MDQQIGDGGIVLGDEPGSGFTIDESALQAPPPEQGWSLGSGPHTRPLRAGLRTVPEDDGLADPSPPVFDPLETGAT